MINTFYITGDTHGDVTNRIKKLVATEGIKDLSTVAIIILGDAGLNYYLNELDTMEKVRVNNYGMYIYCVRGNHEQDPERISTMVEVWDDNVKNYIYYEKEFHYIRYFKDCELYNLNGYKTLVIGGAYSVDKWLRLRQDGIDDTAPEELCITAGWFPHEQLDQRKRRNCLFWNEGAHFDLVLTHTCPISFQPTDLFIPISDPIDNSMELWLEELKNKITFNYWCFGHYHADRLERPNVVQFYQNFYSIETMIEVCSNPEFIRYIPKSPNYYM